MSAAMSAAISLSGFTQPVTITDGCGRSVAHVVDGQLAWLSPVEHVTVTDADGTSMSYRFAV